MLSCPGQVPTTQTSRETVAAAAARSCRQFESCKPSRAKTKTFISMFCANCQLPSFFPHLDIVSVSGC